MMDENIILPIKPCYVEKILNAEKRYEYRKRLCKKNIKKIYLYATAPVKLILGEAEVLKMCKAEKTALWNQTASFSGITKDAYDLYFSGQKDACAYFLGKVKRYDDPVSLKRLGIDYTIQSFLYIGDIPVR